MALDKGGGVPQDWGRVHGTKEGLHGTGEGLYNPGQLGNTSRNAIGWSLPPAPGATSPGATSPWLHNSLGATSPWLHNFLGATSSWLHYLSPLLHNSLVPPAPGYITLWGGLPGTTSA